jgi:proline dehydrogenase
VVIQSCLRRSAADVERLIQERVRVRLCKGAYLEPADVAFPDKADVDRTYVELMEQLLLRGNYPGLATHDATIIGHARRFSVERGIDPARFEFQMLYGVRRDLQDQLRAAGFRVRVYVPFGTQWYPYLMRRLAERPANIAFILGNVVREAVHR